MSHRVSRRSAVSLPLDAMQTMSRGELIYASNILHAGFVQARQQAGSAELRETIAHEETAEARKELACVQVDLQQSVFSLQRQLATSERQSKRHAEEKIRLEALLHAADNELLSQTSLSTLVRATSSPYASSSSSSLAASAPLPAATDAPLDDAVAVPRQELQSLRHVLTSSKFRIADLEDQLLAARADVVKLERVLRSSRGSNTCTKDLDVVEMRCRIDYLERLNSDRTKEVGELREALARSEVQLRTSQHELADALEKLERSIEDDIATGGLAGHSSLLSSSSLGTNAPNQKRKRSSREDSSRIGGGAGGSTGATLSYALPTDTNDDPFGVPLSASVATQTEKLVLQNVELLFQLQRDLFDLQSRREALEAQAQRDTQENLRLAQRVDALEHELQQRSELMQSLAAGAPLGAAAAISGVTSASSAGAAGSGQHHRSKAPAVYTTTGAALLRRNDGAQERDDAAAEKVIVELRYAAAESERRMAELLSGNEKLERRIAELDAALAKKEETTAHLTMELTKSLELVARLQQEKKQLEGLVMGEGHEGGLSDFLSKENSLNLAEGKIHRLEQELETATGLEHRLAALEDELAQAHTDLKSQQNLVLRMAADRDAAMAEVQQLSGSHAQSLRRQAASWKRLVDAVMRWVDARCDAVVASSQSQCKEMVDAAAAAAAHRGAVGVALGSTNPSSSVAFSSYHRQQGSDLESEHGYRSGSSLASLEASRQRVEAEIASRMLLGSRSSSAATAAAATASTTTSPPSSFHIAASKGEPQRQHDDVTPRITLDALAAAIETPLVRRRDVVEEKPSSSAGAALPPDNLPTFRGAATRDLAASTSSNPWRAGGEGPTTQRDLDSPPHRPRGANSTPEKSESATTTTTASPPSPPQSSTGRGMLGALLVEEYGALVIDAVVYDSPAYVSGLKAGDCVCAVDGYVVNTLEEFAEQLSGKTAFALAVIPGARTSLASSPSKDQILLSEGIETVEVHL